MKCWEQLFHIGFLRRTVFTSSQTWGHGAPITTTVTESERLRVSHGPEGLGQGLPDGGASQPLWHELSFISHDHSTCFPLLLILVKPTHFRFPLFEYAMRNIIL